MDKIPVKTAYEVHHSTQTKDYNQMNENEQQRVNEPFAHGTENFTPDDLKKVIDDGETAVTKSGKLGKQFENFKLLWGLLKDYYNKKYPNAPWKLIAAIGFAVAYLISPLDVIPDFLPIVGFVDDASVFALVVAGFSSDIEDYKKWLASQKPKNPPQIKA